MAKVWARIRETIERHGKAGLLSVVGAAGSVPRETGARIVLQPDGGFYGTIGGGRLEYEAIAAARAALSAGRGAAIFRDWPLGPNLGQCCGGAVKTLTETFDAARHAGLAAVGTGGKSRRLPHGQPRRWRRPHRAADRAGRPRANSRNEAPRAFERTPFQEHFGEVTTPVLLFGAGHVGRAVVLALAPLPFNVRWIDSRPDQFPQYVPQNVVTVCTDAVERELAEAPRDAMIVVMTHSHPLDFDISLAALRRRSFDFVGLIGSETKRARFMSFARQMGLPEGDLDRLICPIGITEIKGKEPAVIAAALAAQLLIVSEQVSTRQPSPAMQPA